jgi:hypothetical protein
MTMDEAKLARLICDMLQQVAHGTSRVAVPDTSNVNLTGSFDILMLARSLLAQGVVQHDG